MKFQEPCRNRDAFDSVAAPRSAWYMGVSGTDEGQSATMDAVLCAGRGLLMLSWAPIGMDVILIPPYIEPIPAVVLQPMPPRIFQLSPIPKPKTKSFNI